MRQCTKCKEIKDLSEFYKKKGIKDGLSAQCKFCIIKRVKEYSNNNPEKVALNAKRHRENNKEHYAKKKKERYENNKEEILAKQKERNRKNQVEISKRRKVLRENNKEAIAVQAKKYREENPEKVTERKRRWYQENKVKVNKYYQEKKQNNLDYRISCNLRNRIYQAIKNNTKRGSAVKDLGCTIEELKFYLEQQFQPGMTWDNWSLDGWHIDHRKPLASFDLTNREEFLKACHFSNLQPLWAKDNLSKGCKF